LRCFAYLTWNRTSCRHNVALNLLYGIPNLRHENVYEKWDTSANIRMVTTLSWKFIGFTLRAIYPPEKDLAVLFWELGGSEVNE
jgi:hypothetical protein